jgi:NADH-dependent peroxiredoxin subunit F
VLNLNFESTIKSSLFTDVKKWDLLIIGGGPSGLNAGLYAQRKGLKVGIITKEIGGQLHNTSDVDNYLGIKFIEGKDLSHAFLNHVKSLDVPIYQDVYVVSLKSLEPDFELVLSDGKRLKTKTLLISTGGSPKTLKIPGEIEYSNRGVSYCTTCDAPFFKDKHVIVAGGGNSAAEAVLDLSVWASKVTVIHRSQWRADDILLKKINQLKNVSIHLETQLLNVYGDQKMRGAAVFDKNTQKEYQIEADGLFIEIGTMPKSDIVKDIVKTNASGEIIVDINQMTSFPGIYAAGDVTDQPYKQIIISAAEGAKAALAINHYLTHHYKGE